MLLPAILSAVGTGVSFIGQMQQASAAEGIARQNAAAQSQNAGIQARSLQAQAEISRLQARQNFQNRRLEAVQANRNADAKRGQAAVQQSLNAQNIRRKREQGQRVMAGQRAKFAAAGVVDSTGSPLALLAETAGLIEQDIQERTYHNELAATGLLQQSALERLGGQYALAGATLDRNAGLSEASMRDASATATLLTGNRQAEITRLAGRAQGQGLRGGAFGNLLSGAADTYAMF